MSKKTKKTPEDLRLVGYLDVTPTDTTAAVSDVVLKLNRRPTPTEIAVSTAQIEAANASGADDGPFELAKGTTVATPDDRQLIRLGKRARLTAVDVLPVVDGDGPGTDDQDGFSARLDKITATLVGISRDAIVEDDTAERIADRARRALDAYFAS